MTRLRHWLRKLSLPALVLACVACSAASQLAPADRVKIGITVLREACAACLNDDKCSEPDLREACQAFVLPDRVEADAGDPTDAGVAQ